MAPKQNLMYQSNPAVSIPPPPPNKPLQLFLIPGVVLLPNFLRAVVGTLTFSIIVIVFIAYYANQSVLLTHVYFPVYD
jgi:hypothetical protein